MRRSICAAVLLSAACSGAPPGGDGTPRPSEVEPARGYPTAPVAVVIRGDGFDARVRQPSGGGAASLDTAHRAWLDDVELDAVTWRDVHTLEATVPPGLGLGPHRLTVQDPLGRRGSLEAAYTVLAAPAFAATAAVDRSAVDVGQEFTLTVTVTNSGGAEVVAVAAGPAAFGSAGGGAAEATSAPPPPAASLAPGESHAFTWRCVGTAEGLLAAGATVTAVDGLTGAALTATPLAPAQVAVQRPAALAVAESGGLAVPGAVPVGADFDVTLTVANVGGAAAREVTPGALSIAAGSTGSAAYKSGPRPASAAIEGGASATFTWTFTARSPGSLQLAGAAAGADANTAAPVGTAPARSNTAALLPRLYRVTVTVTSGGGPSGGVTSDPPGIACLAGDVCDGFFEAGQGVTLSATSTAVLWSGCDTAVGATCTLNALAGPRAVVAAF